MPQPTVNALHVDRPLTQISVGYRNDTYISDKIFPIVPVQKQSDKYFVYTKGDWFRNEAQLRAPGSEPVASGFNVSSTNTYLCREVGISYPIPDEELANTDDPINLEIDGVNFVTDRIMLKREVDWATNNFVAGAWATSSTGNTADFVQWSNYGASDPTVDVLKYQNQVRGSIARLPNKAVVGFGVLVQLQNHPVLVDRIKYSQKGVMTQQLIAELLGLDELLIGQAIYNTAAEGQTAVFADVWGKSVLLAYVNPSPALRSASAGYQFVWQAVPGAAQFIRRERDERKRTSFITGGSYYDQKIVATDAGHMMTAVVA